MARDVEITYACGHTCTVTISGKGDYIEWKAKQLAQEDCPDCIEKARHEESERCAAENKENGFCELKGSVRQIRWAETIRSNYMEWIMELEQEFSRRLSHVKDEDDKEFYEKMVRFLRTQAEDHVKNMSDAGLIIYNRTIDNLKYYLYNKTIEWKEPKAEVEEETETKIYEPEEPKQDGFVEIKKVHDEDDQLEVLYMNNKSFNNAMHKYGFTYNSDAKSWKKKAGVIGFKTLDDLGADLANYLISKGFRVKTKVDGIKYKLENTWDPVNFRLIYLDQSEKYFIFETDDETEKIVREIPKVYTLRRWDSSYPQKFKVSVHMADIVQDVAETCNFEMSLKAKKKLANVLKGKKEKIMPKEIQSNPVELRREDNEIIDDLIDD